MDPTPSLRPRAFAAPRFFSALKIVFALSLTAGATPSAEAIPLFANRHDLTCGACHSIPPRLNEGGLAFKARGYRSPEPLPEGVALKEAATRVPFATWITARHENRTSDDLDDTFLPKVELIGGGPIGDSVSYFAEWRVVSLSLRGDGSLQDRGGRFEDLFFDWSFADRHSLTVGQFRSLNQVDVSLRLSPSEPQLFRNGLRVDTDPDPRLNSLMTFSPSSRSPGIGYSFQSLEGETESDGLFHHVTLPFVGELSLPLSPEARDEASFELTGPPKGVFLETFYRRGLDSLGVHAFVADDAWLLTGLAALNLRRDFYLTAGLGVDDRDEGDTRERLSLELEYVGTRRDRWRTGAGLRIEDVSQDGRGTAFVPYFMVAGPNLKHSFLLQIQYKEQDDNDSFVIDFSAMF